MGERQTEENFSYVIWRSCVRSTEIASFFLHLGAIVSDVFALGTNPFIILAAELCIADFRNFITVPENLYTRPRGVTGNRRKNKQSATLKYYHM